MSLTGSYFLMVDMYRFCTTTRNMFFTLIYSKNTPVCLTLYVFVLQACLSALRWSAEAAAAAAGVVVAGVRSVSRSKWCPEGPVEDHNPRSHPSSKRGSCHRDQAKIHHVRLD